MTLSNEAEELLDVLRRRVLDKELREIAELIESGIAGEDLKNMQFLEKLILTAYHAEGIEGYWKRQAMCEEIAKANHGEPQRKAS